MGFSKSSTEHSSPASPTVPCTAEKISYSSILRGWTHENDLAVICALREISSRFFRTSLITPNTLKVFSWGFIFANDQGKNFSFYFFFIFLHFSMQCGLCLTRLREKCDFVGIYFREWLKFRETAKISNRQICTFKVQNRRAFYFM